MTTVNGTIIVDDSGNIVVDDDNFICILPPTPGTERNALIYLDGTIDGTSFKDKTNYARHLTINAGVAATCTPYGNSGIVFDNGPYGGGNECAVGSWSAVAWPHEIYKTKLTIGLCVRLPDWTTINQFGAVFGIGDFDGSGTADLIYMGTDSAPGMSRIFDDWNPDTPMGAVGTGSAIPNNTYVWMWYTYSPAASTSTNKIYFSVDFRTLVEGSMSPKFSGYMKLSEMNMPIRPSSLFLAAQGAYMTGVPSTYYSADILQYCMFERVVPVAEMKAIMQRNIVRPPSLTVTGTLTPDVTGVYQLIDCFDATRPIYQRGGGQYGIGGEPFIYKGTTGDSWSINTGSGDFASWETASGPYGAYTILGGSADGIATVSETGA